MLVPIIPIYKEETLIGFVVQDKNHKHVIYTCEVAGWKETEELLDKKDKIEKVIHTTSLHERTGGV